MEAHAEPHHIAPFARGKLDMLSQNVCEMDVDVGGDSQMREMCDLAWYVAVSGDTVTVTFCLGTVRLSRWRW